MYFLLHATLAIRLVLHGQAAILFQLHEKSFVEAEQVQNGGLTMLDSDRALHVMQRAVTVAHFGGPFCLDVWIQS